MEIQLVEEEVLMIVRPEIAGRADEIRRHAPMSLHKRQSAKKTRDCLATREPALFFLYHPESTDEHKHPIKKNAQYVRKIAARTLLLLAGQAHET